MKNLILFAVTAIVLFSCKSSWTVEDQEEYLNDCLSMSQMIGNAEEICECGLQKAMENYKTKEKAEEAVKNMTEDEVYQFFAECM